MRRFRIAALHLVLAGCVSSSALLGGEPRIVPLKSPAISSRQAVVNPRLTPVVQVVRRVREAVVNIHSERTVAGLRPEELLALAPSQNRINGMGTGIILDPRGYILTNHHVVEDVNSLRVRLADGTATAARVIARDPASDLALLKIDLPRQLPTMPLGTSQDVMVGETVVAIGNAYGYDHTVSVGIVSAIKRDVALNKEIAYKSLIQTDAAINPGNSGGPLININGDLIGVNVAIRAGAQGIGFAIPVDSMLRVAADLIAVRRHCNLHHGIIGKDQVQVEQSGAFTRELLIENVDPEGPAARAGLTAGDRITRVAGLPSKCCLDLERALLDRAPGDRVVIEFTRGGTAKKTELTLEAAEKVSNVQAELVWKKLGFRTQRVGAEAVARANHQLQGGLVLTEIRPGSPAAKAGLQRGDVLVSLHQYQMLSLENVTYVLNNPEAAGLPPLRFHIIRSGQVFHGWFQGLD